MCKLNFALAGLVLVHSWYPHECCGDEHCHSVPCTELNETWQGVWWHNILFRRDQIKPSLDADCHVCEVTGHPYCVFVRDSS